MDEKLARDYLTKVAETHRKNGKPEEADKIEILREYLLNPLFRKGLEDWTYEQNK